MKVLNKLPKNVPKIDNEERKRIIQTRLQQAGLAPMKRMSELSKEEFYNFKQDIEDTHNYVLNNRAKFGENYELALDVIGKLKVQWLEEEKRRNNDQR